MDYLANLEAAIEILRERPLLREVHGSALISGDIHGDIGALEKTIRLREELNTDYLILLGDYVDRGSSQIEVIQRIAELVQQDDQFIPLRGNHEDILVCSRYGFIDKVKNQNHKLSPYMDLFSHLPISAQSDDVFLVHGGLPINEDFRTEMINSFQRKPEIDQNSRELLWNDPIFNPEFWLEKMQPSPRGAGCYQFGEPVTDDFLSTHDLSMVIRAHTFLPHGSEWLHNDQILSIFTSRAGPYNGVTRTVAELNLDNTKTINLHFLDEQGQ